MLFYLREFIQGAGKWLAGFTREKQGPKCMTNGKKKTKFEEKQPNK